MHQYSCEQQQQKSSEHSPQ